MTNPLTKIAHRLRGGIHQRIGLPLRLIANYAYDFRRFRKLSGLNRPFSRKASLEAWITKDYHRIEKALALKNPRPGFGAKVVADLSAAVTTYIERYGLDDTAEVTLNVLDSYCDFNDRHGIDNAATRGLLVRLREKYSRVHSCPDVEGGAIDITSAEIKASATIDFRRFADTRHSVRHFGDLEITDEQIVEATRIAQRSPSVCNRQPWRLHCFAGREVIADILKYQNGNRGFGDSASRILLVTCSLDAFLSVGERNQAFIDGGLFSMSLIYALHSMGLGTCCLNLSIEKETDLGLRSASNLPPEETVMMMIAVGSLPEKLKVAKSHRKPVEHVVTFHNS